MYFIGLLGGFSGIFVKFVVVVFKFGDFQSYCRVFQYRSLDLVVEFGLVGLEGVWNCVFGVVVGDVGVVGAGFIFESYSRRRFFDAQLLEFGEMGKGRDCIFVWDDETEFF